MWALILIGVLFGCLFLCLSLHSFQRRQEWRGAVRLKAWVIDVRYQEARGKGQIIEDDKSATEVTVRFSYGGREFIKQKVYRGIIGTPLRGQKLPIWFKPQDGRSLPAALGGFPGGGSGNSGRSVRFPGRVAKPARKHIFRDGWRDFGRLHLWVRARPASTCPSAYPYSHPLGHQECLWAA